MKISTKLVLLFLLIILPLIFIPIYLYKTINQSLKITQYVINHDLPVQNNSRELEKLIVEIHSEHQTYINTGEKKSLQRFMSLIDQFDILFEKQIQLLQGNTIELRRLQSIKKLHNDWFVQAVVPSIVSRVDSNLHSVTYKAYNDSSFSTPILDEIQKQFFLINSEQDRLSRERKISSENLTDSLQRILIITLSLVFAGFGVFLLIVMKLYVDPLNRLIEVSRTILGGDMNKRAEVHSSDEIGQLEMTFNKMIDMISHSYAQLEERVRERTNQLAENMRVLEREKAKDEALLANIGEGIIATNTQGVVLFANKATHEMLGWTTKEMVGRHLGDTVSIQDEMGGKLSAEKQLIHQALTTGKKLITTINTPYYWLRRDGTRFPAAITVTPIRSGDETIGAIIIFRDFTKEKEVDKAKNEFVSLASHQLRTPLSIINWYSEMFSAGDAGKMTKKQEKYIYEIYHANERMIELVSALLNVSRLDLGTFIFEPEDINIVNIIQKSISEQKNTIEEKKLILKEIYPVDPVVLRIDPKIAMIIFQNLITNAIKYTPAAGTIEIEIIPRRSPEHTILIRIADTGYGIPKAEHAKIFAKLYRATNVRTKDTEGTGLGLYLVRAVVHKLGGKIWFESEENKGSTFYVSLPFHDK